MGKVKKRLALLLMLALMASLLLGCAVTPASQGAVESGQGSQSLQPSDELVLPVDDSWGENSLEEIPAPAETASPAEEALPDEDGSYTTKEDLALYIHLYGHLPPNFITKDEARAAGWNGGSLEPYCPGKCIGGDRFGNREGQLPREKGRVWTECDVNTLGKRSRGAERIVFSNDGLIYYTGDHYESFEQLY